MSTVDESTADIAAPIKQTVYELAIEDIEREIALAEKITVKDHTDTAGIEAAHKQHRIFVKMRTTTEKTRLEGGAQMRQDLKDWNALGNDMIEKMSPSEERMKELAETAKREEARQFQIRQEARAAETKRRCDLCNAIGLTIPITDLEAMVAGEFDPMYDAAKEAYDAKQVELAAASEAARVEAARLEKVDREQAEKQAALDRQQAEIDAKQREIEEAELAAKLVLIQQRASALGAVGYGSDLTGDELAAMSQVDFDALLAEKTAEHEVAQKEAAERAAKEEAEVIARGIAAEAERQAAEALAVDEQRKADAAKAPVREKIAVYKFQVETVELPPKMKAATLKAIKDARTLFLAELDRIAARL